MAESKRRRVRLSVIGILIALVLEAGLSLPAFAEEVHHFDIDTTDAAIAIHQFGSQSGVQILASAEALNGKRLNRIAGDLSTDDGFQLLLAGTGLSHRYVGERAVALVSATGVSGEDAGNSDAAAARRKVSNGVSSAQAEPSTQSTSTAIPSQQGQRIHSEDVDRAEIGEILVTGSRLRQVAAEGSLPVSIYSRGAIESSGQTTVTGFLNTLPAVSTAVTEAGLAVARGATAIQLHGMPVGTTLVLINGRRSQVSATGAAGGGYFDPSSIPLAAVERIEVVSVGTSAVYGSDAIAGVVNIILRDDFDGISATLKYGSTSDGALTDANATLAWGHVGTNGGFSLVASYRETSELIGAERTLTATSDFTPYGGADVSTDACHPGNIYSLDGQNLPGLPAQQAGVPAGITGTATIQDFQATAGIVNRCADRSQYSLIPESERISAILSGHYAFGVQAELFGEVLFARDTIKFGDPTRLSNGAFGFFTVSPDNPFNPFDVRVGVSTDFTEFGRLHDEQDKTFLRPLIGLRGGFASQWDWEIAAWESNDQAEDISTGLDSAAVQAALDSTDPASALNAFTAGPKGSAQLLDSLIQTTQVSDITSRLRAASAFLRGPILSLPAGAVEIVFGGEYDRSKIEIGPNVMEEPLRRTNYAAFVEARVPLWASSNAATHHDRLALSLAGRYDHYSDFGDATTPQLGVEFRPTDNWLLRGSYGEAFRAPQLFDLHSPSFGPFPEQIVDLARGGEIYVVDTFFGGNANLNAETGESSSFGFVYSNSKIPNFDVSATHFRVIQDDSVTFIFSSATLIGNEQLFPGAIIRQPPAGGQPGLITTINYSPYNFGRIKVSGIDYAVSYRFSTRIGSFKPSLYATQIYEYSAALSPGIPATERAGKAADDGKWAPSWKGTLGMEWALGPITTNVNGRYVGDYEDYGGTGRELGDDWFVDAHFRIDLDGLRRGVASPTSDVYLDVGVINAFDTEPEYSNFVFGLIGYDPAQSDIRGRFIYAEFGMRW